MTRPAPSPVPMSPVVHGAARRLPRLRLLRRTASSLLAAVLLVGTVGTLGTSPVDAAPSSAVATSATSSSNTLRQRPLRLEQALGEARQHNRVLQAAVLDARASQAGVRVEEGRLSPTLSLNLTAKQDEKNPAVGLLKDQRSVTSGASLGVRLPTGGTVSVGVNGGLTAFDDADLESALDAGGALVGGQVNLTQPLLRGVGTTLQQAERRRANLQQLADEVAENAVAAEVVRDVVLAYQELWFAERQLDLEHEARRVSAERLHQTERRIAVGVSPERERAQAASQLADRDAAVLSAEQRVVERSLALSRLLGVGDDDGLSAAEAPQSLFGTLDSAVASLGDAFDIEGVVAGAAPDVKRARARLAQAGESVRVAGESTRPRLDLQLGLSTTAGANGLNDARSFDDLNSAAPMSGQVGLVFEAPTFGDPWTQDRRRASLAQDAAAERVQIAVDTARSSAAADLNSLARADAQLAAAERFRDNAQQTLHAAEVRYAAGDAIALEVQSAENDLRRAAVSIERLQVDRNAAAIRLLHNAGELPTVLASTPMAFVGG